jgi:6,7-dimethyl-8-ribityllumazine synthase
MEVKMSENVGKVYEGNLKADNLKFGIVCSRFNDFFVSKLLSGAIDTLVRHGGSAKNIEVVWVPGSYELPFAVKKMAERRKYNAVIALGVVIQGATPHAGYINSEVSKALGQIGLDTGIPTIYGIITADNIEQAIERSGTKAGNKGADAAIAAIEMANLVKTLE